MAKTNYTAYALVGGLAVGGYFLYNYFKNKSSSSNPMDQGGQGSTGSLGGAGDSGSVAAGSGSLADYLAAQTAFNEQVATQMDEMKKTNVPYWLVQGLQAQVDSLTFPGETNAKKGTVQTYEVANDVMKKQIVSDYSFVKNVTGGNYPLTDSILSGVKQTTASKMAQAINTNKNPVVYNQKSAAVTGLYESRNYPEGPLAKVGQIVGSEGRYLKSITSTQIAGRNIAQMPLTNAVMTKANQLKSINTQAKQIQQKVAVSKSPISARNPTVARIMKKS